MSECLSFLSQPQDWIRSISLLFERLETWSRSLCSTEVKLFRAVKSLRVESHRHRASLQGHYTWTRTPGSPQLLERFGIYRVNRRRKATKCYSDPRTSTTIKDKEFEDYHVQENMVDTSHRNKVSTKSRGEEPRLGENAMYSLEDYYGKTASLATPSRRIMSINGGNDSASLFTQKGMKEFNQDSMLLWEGFTTLAPNTIFCGVFDGHGPHGHFISKNVRDILPVKLASFWETLITRRYQESCKSSKFNAGGDPDLIFSWKEAFQTSYKMMDRELLINDDVDCVFSGTTAATLVKQGRDLIIGNVGDSRAVMGVKSSKDTLVALQLTVDLTPNVPKEAERIRRRKGRVFALAKDPLVKRVWLPHDNVPGLAMSRALGDYSLKNYGVIAAPEVTYRHIMDDDKFIVLATDGVWNVLSNEEVVKIVDSTSVRSLAAKAVVDAALKLWKHKYSFVKRDDCAVVCLFLD